MNRKHELTLAQSSHGQELN